MSDSGMSRPTTIERWPDPAAIDAEYAKDRWQAAALGVPAPRGRGSVRFIGISQPWLRPAVKEWCRWRLAIGCAWGTVSASATAVDRFSSFLAACEPDSADGAVVTRLLLERFISWLAATGLAATSRSLTLICLRGFLEQNHRHGWLPEIPTDAVIYQDDLPRRDTPLPRFVPEFVMAQLEADGHLALLEPDIRHLIIVLMETGLRAGDACTLPFNPLVDDSVGWPCLCFHNGKARAEQMVPLSGRAVMAIRDQQTHVRAVWPKGSRWLFPDPKHNPDGTLPFAYWTLKRQLGSWQDRIGLHDQTGAPVRVSAHQFRHTVGTRLINAGVPQHIVQRLLGHASPRMTAVYAQLYDTTIRQAFDRYQQQRIDISGRLLDYDPESPTADAEWIKHNLNRIQASLPNGYCGRPPQQECPHPNACLTCPQFQTTVEFLPVHRQHAERNRELLELAEAHGRQRLVDNHRRVQDSLERIIPALQAVQQQALADNDAPDDA
jgi:site-specific recombinase XerD